MRREARFSSLKDRQAWEIPATDKTELKQKAGAARKARLCLARVGFFLFFFSFHYENLCHTDPFRHLTDSVPPEGFTAQGGRQQHLEELDGPSSLPSLIAALWRDTSAQFYSFTNTTHRSQSRSKRLQTRGHGSGEAVEETGEAHEGPEERRVPSWDSSGM